MNIKQIRLDSLDRMKTGHLNPVLTVYSLYMALMKVEKPPY